MPEISLKELDLKGLVAVQAYMHMREFRPLLFARLQKQGKEALRKECHDQAKACHSQAVRNEEGGQHPAEAWNNALRETIILPEGPEE